MVKQFRRSTEEAKYFIATQTVGSGLRSMGLSGSGNKASQSLFMAGATLQGSHSPFMARVVQGSQLTLKAKAEAGPDHPQSR